MRNIFLLYMPPGNREAMLHYQETIQQRVTLERVAMFVTRHEAGKLREIFGTRRLAVWGSRASSRNRSSFDRMIIGDDLLIVEGGTIRFMGKVALKTMNPALSRELWRPINPTNDASWDLVYFIANPVEMNVPFTEFCRLFSYASSFQLRGFTAVSTARLQEFYNQYDDLYSVLDTIRAGRQIVPKASDITDSIAPVPLAAAPYEGLDRSDTPVISEHSRMQWTLANLGMKAGEKVWVPSGDRARLTRLHGFTPFESEFAAGIDLPRNYYQNIDVVWKEEFRINAAFEVENSTAIYSGLLRFADLNVVAPNSTYPMFIVAPAERRGQVREQLQRPVFRKLDLRDKVRFLPYETVDEIDRFFSSATSGLSVDLIVAKAEALV